MIYKFIDMQDPIENPMLKSTVEGQLSAADSNTIIELNSRKNQFRRSVSRINTKIFAGVVICTLKQLSIYFKTFFFMVQQYISNDRSVLFNCWIWILKFETRKIKEETKKEAIDQHHQWRLAPVVIFISLFIAQSSTFLIHLKDDIFATSHFLFHCQTVSKSFNRFCDEVDLAAPPSFYFDFGHRVQVLLYELINLMWKS